MKKLLRSTLLHNIIALYGLQAATYILPLVVIPYLARAIGLSAWGQLAQAQSISAYVALITEYGFGLSGTRELCHVRDDPFARGRLLSSILTAKLVLISGCVCIAVAFHFLFNRASADLLVPQAVYAGAMQGLSMAWYFQALERMRTVAAIEIGGKVLATLALFQFVRTADDVGTVLVCYGTASLITAGITLALALRDTRLHPPSVMTIKDTLSLGWQMFRFRSAVTLYTAANPLILGRFATTAQVGNYAAGEKVARATVGLLTPVVTACFPRISFLASQNAAEARAVQINVLRAMALAGAIMTLTLIGIPGTLASIAFGSRFPAVSDILRMLSILPLLTAISNALGVQWLVPMGRDRTFNRIIISGGAVNIVLALLLTPAFHDYGMAVSVLCAEATVTLSMVVVVFGMPFRPCQRSANSNPDRMA